MYKYFFFIKIMIILFIFDPLKFQLVNYLWRMFKFFRRVGIRKGKITGAHARVIQWHSYN